MCVITAFGFRRVQRVLRLVTVRVIVGEWRGRDGELGSDLGM